MSDLLGCCGLIIQLHFLMIDFYAFAILHVVMGLNPLKSPKHLAVQVYSASFTSDSMQYSGICEIYQRSETHS